MAQQSNMRSLEALIWAGRPSQTVNSKFFTLYGSGLLVCFILLFTWPIIASVGMLVFLFLIFDKYVEARDTKYDLTHERIKIVSGGILTQRQTAEIDINDLIDVKINETFFQQLSKTGNITLEFKGDPLTTGYRDLVKKERHILLEIKDPQRAYEIIRACIKKTLNTQTLDLDNPYDLGLDRQAKNKPKLLR